MDLIDRQSVLPAADWSHSLDVLSQIVSCFGMYLKLIGLF